MVEGPHEGKTHINPDEAAEGSDRRLLTADGFQEGKQNVNLLTQVSIRSYIAQAVATVASDKCPRLPKGKHRSVLQV